MAKGKEQTRFINESGKQRRKHACENSNELAEDTDETGQQQT